MVKTQTDRNVRYDYVTSPNTESEVSCLNMSKSQISESRSLIVVYTTRLGLLRHLGGNAVFFFFLVQKRVRFCEQHAIDDSRVRKQIFFRNLHARRFDYEVVRAATRKQKTLANRTRNAARNEISFIRRLLFIVRSKAVVLR